jgi:hypothetical protein
VSVSRQVPVKTRQSVHPNPISDPSDEFQFKACPKARRNELISV